MTKKANKLIIFHTSLTTQNPCLEVVINKPSESTTN